jgi:hypothetical protein
MGGGMAVTPLYKALIIHAAGASIFFAVLSWVYFERFNYASPLLTASIFVSFAVLWIYLLSRL